MNEAQERPVILNYLNYREYLKDLFRYLKKTQKQFSQKWVMSELGIDSKTGFLSNIFTGRKNLTPVQVEKLAKIISLDRTEKQYFELLVYFTQAKTVEEKNEFFSRLMTLQTASLKTLNPKQMTLFSRWYFVFIREILEFYPVRNNYENLAKMLTPPISAKQAKEAVETLLKLKLIERDETGYLQTVDQAISTGDEVQNRQLAQFQLFTLDLAKNALQTIPSKERDISILTMSLSPDNFRLIKSELQHFRKRIARIAVEETSAKRLYQMNFQFFPVSKMVKEKSL